MDASSATSTACNNTPAGRHKTIARNTAAEALFGSRPSKKVSRIGLYDVIEKINQNEQKAVYIAAHRYIKTRPKTILKVFHFDVYASPEEKQRQIDAIFHDSNAVRMLGAHPNIINVHDIFAWEGDKFVLPTEYVEGGRPLGVGADHPAQSAAGAAAAYALVVLFARWFGAGSGVSWVYAALAAGGASALRGALGAQTPADVVSGVLGALVATALAMVLYRAAHPAAEGGRQ